MTNSTDSLKLGTCAAGFTGEITGFIGENNTNTMIDQLREIGFAEGLSVEILHQNPFGRDPIAVKVGSMTVAVRRREANFITVTAS